MRKKLIVGNWKMHMNVAEASRFVHRLEKRVTHKANTEVVLCPSFVALQPLMRQLDDKKFSLGAQNLHYVDEGAYTGEVSAAQLQGLVTHAVIGHSERRRIFNEREEEIARKVSAAVRHNITPILCVGENLYERQDQETGRVIHDQLVAGLTMLTGPEVANIVVAYEPVWAIGTGEIAKPEQVSQGTQAIRKTVSELYGKTAGTKLKVLYGGSVVADYAQDYLKIAGVDGLLVGGASLNYDQLALIIKLTQNL